MLLGADAPAVLAILEGLPIDVIGLNCSTGPDHMRESIRYLAEQSSLPVSCIPDAGLPLNVDGQAVYPLEPEPFAAALAEYVDKFHVNVVGGCCGTTPAHLSRLVEKIGGRAQAPRSENDVPWLASATQAVPMQQEPRPFLIGERLNSQGSLKFKKLLLAEDYDGITAVARQQVNGGAHGLDVCVALTERADESEQMRKVIKTLASVVRAPLVIDTTEPEVMEAALQTAPGRSLINSTNLESGTAKAEKVFALARKYNAAVIVLTIDETGMARTAERKLEIARRIVQLATEDFGLRPCDLVVDALTFTLATGDPDLNRSAMDTLEGIRRIKAELPGVLTSLGVSNVSFGLPPAARGVLNSVMLYHAVQAGLDMAIVNPAQITPYPEIDPAERELAEDLIFNCKPDALMRLVEAFSNPDARAEADTAKKSPTDGMDAAQRIHWRIVHREKEGLEGDIDELILPTPKAQRAEVAVGVLNQVLLPAMKEVGDKFGTGELILPFVLQSAEVMKKAVNQVEKYLERKEGSSKGTLVLATVYGDVHDIGKNLVKTILSNNGFTVVDLGKQVPVETIIAKAVEVNADAIGLSALLVNTSKQMPLVVNELQRRGIHIPVLIGGAAINRRFGRRILLTESQEYYVPGVFYCKDAFEGLAVMEKLCDPGQRQELIDQTRKEADFELGRERRPTVQTTAVGHSSVAPAVSIPAVPGWGPRVVKSMPLPAVFERLAKNELFRLSWGAKNAHGAEWDKIQAEFGERLLKMEKQAEQECWLQPQGIYGYWPAQSEGNDLILYDPASLTSTSPRELLRFSFPRQADGERLCLADYFSPVGAAMDVAAFQVVTVGQAASARFEKLEQAGDYSEAYFTHGLSVQTAEAAADYLHGHIRRELGLPAGQGKRYSWGYPAIPELSDHARVFELLPAESELGMRLTEAFQLIPEQSTAAIVVHHPAASYFSLGEARIEQLTR
jgi:5-methyltetrahydrofolate--homocysteine methyltransferase